MTAPVMTPTRRELLMRVRDAPGSSTRALARSVGLDDSSAAYHLNRLAKVGLVVEERAGNVLAHYPAGWGDARARSYATISREARVALAILGEFGHPARAAEVARWSGMPLTVARHALALAERRGLARRSSGGKFEVIS